MYQVTAIFEGCEIGYGEGESGSYAIEDCIDSIDNIYCDQGLTIDLHVLSNSKTNTIPLGYVYRFESNVFMVNKVSVNKQLV